MTTTPSQPGAAEPAISVVMPAFNSAKWIVETLASVAAQTIGPDLFEVIVVDDGSADGTAEVAERFLAATPLHWCVLRQENGGPSRARNVGLKRARGTWIQFLDADDLIDPEKLRIQWDKANELTDAAAVVFSPWRKFGTIDARFETGEVVAPRFRGNVVDELFTERVSIATGAQIYRKSWVDRAGGWNESHTNGEDHELALRVAFGGGEYHEAPSTRPLFFYRRQGVSLSTRSGQKNAEVWPRLARFVEEQSRLRNELSPSRLAHILRIYGGGARWLADHDWPAAEKLIRRVHELEPNYRPEWSSKFRMLTSVVGLRNAIWLASRMRFLTLWFARPPRLTTVSGPEFSLPRHSSPPTEIAAS